jgi:WD40 repeat protein
MMLRREDAGFVKCLAFHPDDHWLAIANGGSLSLWPLNWPWSRVLGGIETAPIYDLEFTPGGERLLAAAGDGVSIWPLRSGQGQSRRPGARRTCYALAVDPAGQNFVRFYPGGEVVLEPLSGEPDDGPRVLFGSDERQVAAAALTFDPTGRKVVAGAQWAADTSPALRITDLDTGEVRSFPLRSPSSQETPHGDWLRDLRFAPDGTLYSGGFGGVRRWDTSTGEFEWILQAHPQSHTRIEIDRDGGWLLALWWISETASELRLIDLTDDAAREITSHGRSLTASTLEESGEMIVTGDADGVIRVSRVADGEPHLLIGHEGAIDVVVVSTDRRWIASGAGDEIRLWPMPDLSKPPLHTLPRSQLIAKLETLTNVRVVRDEESATGWKLTHDPFPGWETVPTW